MTDQDEQALRHCWNGPVSQWIVGRTQGEFLWAHVDESPVGRWAGRRCLVPFRTLYNGDLGDLQRPSTKISVS